MMADLPKDESGRTIYGAHVHLDFFPFRYFVAAGAVYIISWFAPHIIAVILVLLLVGTAMYNLAALRPANYKKR
jgi:uncharacterized membrane protein